MADYYPLISRAVAGLEKNSGENRRALYERARAALLAQLRGVSPALNEFDITRERLALEESIRKVEAESARRFAEPSRQPPPSEDPAGGAAICRARDVRAALAVEEEDPSAPPPRRYVNPPLRWAGRTAGHGATAAALSRAVPIRCSSRRRPTRAAGGARVIRCAAARRAPAAVRCRPQGFPQRRPEPARAGRQSGRSDRAARPPMARRRVRPRPFAAAFRRAPAVRPRRAAADLRAACAAGAHVRAAQGALRAPGFQRADAGIAPTRSTIRVRPR